MCMQADDLSKDLILKRVLYRATYRGGKEADYIFKNFALKYGHDLTNRDLQDLDALLQEDDSFIFSWLDESEDIPEKFNTPILTLLRHYFNSLRF